ncbi:GNAT family N-acetyltransferase [Streptomyces sp. NPDC058231]|uniref:GNAT family N-acetyltransferase n=1 Tax=Streptomyces sp. NPDC058231 TaxID=3346392 RepID=UPI0036E4B5D3
MEWAVSPTPSAARASPSPAPAGRSTTPGRSCRAHPGGDRRRLPELRRLHHAGGQRLPHRADAQRAWRGRGLARITGSATVARALAAGLLPQWRARVPSSRRVALALGFRELFSSSVSNSGSRTVLWGGRCLPPRGTLRIRTAATSRRPRPGKHSTWPVVLACIGGFGCSRPRKRSCLRAAEEFSVLSWWSPSPV